MYGFLQTFFTLFIELTALFIVISFLVSLLQQKVTDDRIQRILHRTNPWSGYLYGTGLGALTPFCSCSTIPILAGLLSSKAPFGPSMSFLIASPLLNPVVLLLMWTLTGWELTLHYAMITALFAILIGFGLEKLGFRHSVKQVRVRKGNRPNDDTHIPLWKTAFQDAWSFFYPILPFLVLGVFIGSFIYDVVPRDMIASFAGADKPWAIPAASVLGIPMYIRVEAMLPIGDALLSKGMSVGAVVALLIGGAGASIPEVVLLSRLFKRKLIAAFVVSILTAAIGTGFIVQIIL